MGGRHGRLIGEVVFLYIARFALAIPLIKLGRISVNRTLFADLQAVNRERESFFPALHGANFAPQIRRYFAPRLEPALLAGAVRSGFWHGWGIRVQTYTGVYSAIARGETSVSVSEGSSEESLGGAVAPQCQSNQHGDHRDTGEKKSERAGLWR